MDVQGFELAEGGKYYVNKELGIEVWPYHDGYGMSWGFNANVLGYDISREEYRSADDAAADSLLLVPTEETARLLLRETFDSMSDPDRLSLVQELDYEHGNCFEWSDVMPLDDFLANLSKEELVKVAIYGDFSNEIDPVRYDKYGDAEQVSYEELYSEVCENEDEILGVLADVLDRGLGIYSSRYFDALGDAISDGTWRDWMDDDKLCGRQEV